MRQKRGQFRTLSNIYDGSCLGQYLLALIIIAKKSTSEMFDVALNVHLKRVTESGLKQVLLKRFWTRIIPSDYSRIDLEELRINERAQFLTFLETLKVKERLLTFRIVTIRTLDLELLR